MLLLWTEETQTPSPACATVTIFQLPSFRDIKGAYLVWREGVWKARQSPLGLFLGQLFLNAIWTPLFFGMHQIGLALIDNALLWMARCATLIAFWQVSRPEWWWLVPYLTWVSFAAFLNFTLWRMNVGVK